MIRRRLSRRRLRALLDFHARPWEFASASPTVRQGGAPVAALPAHRSTG